MARARAQQGFTLIELMIAITIGTMAVSSIYMVGKGSNHYFQQQYRVTHAVSRLRVAMGQIKRDLQRAGFMATANANGDSTCGPTPIPAAGLNYAGVLNHVKAFGGAVGMDPGSVYPANTLPADELRLLGNYETAAEYAGLKNPTKDGLNLEIEQWWQSFRGNFHVWESGTPTAFDRNRMLAVFKQNRPVRVSTNLGRYHFSTVRAVLDPLTDPAGNVRIQLDPANPVPQSCRLDLDGGWIAPLKAIEYRVLPNAAAAAKVFDPNETMPELIRQELDFGGGAPTERMVIAQYVVRFNVDFLPMTLTTPPTMDWNVDNSKVLSQPQALRIARVTLSVRSPGFDPTFPLASPIESEPFRRFVTSTNAVGAARVRTLRADIFLPNMVRSQ